MTETKNSPPFKITPAIVSLVAEISQSIGRLSAMEDALTSLRLRRVNRLRSIRGSLAIEGNTLSEKQITAIFEGKRVIAPPREIQEVRNAIKAYDMVEKWNPFFAHFPVESLVHEHQAEYYAALNMSSENAESSVFIEFMLKMILNTVKLSYTPEVTPEVKKMLKILEGEMTRMEIQQKLGLKDEKHFRTAYQQPAIASGLIEMTVPGKPNSRLQKYRITPKGRLVIER